MAPKIMHTMSQNVVYGMKWVDLKSENGVMWSAHCHGISYEQGGIALRTHI